jgi:hypothetical protein
MPQIIVTAGGVNASAPVPDPDGGTRPLALCGPGRPRSP